MDANEALSVFAALARHEVEYVLVGGAALNFHGIIRATEDLDIFVRPTDENVGRLRRALREVWDDPNIETFSAVDLAGDYPAIRYYPPDGDLYLDIVSRFGEAFAYDDLEAEQMEVQGVSIRIASPRTLFRMKKDTVRPLDRADAEMLRQEFDLE